MDDAENVKSAAQTAVPYSVEPFKMIPGTFKWFYGYVFVVLDNFWN